MAFPGPVGSVTCPPGVTVTASASASITTSHSTGNSGLGRPRRKGARKNLLAMRICACVVNLHTLDHAQHPRDAA